MTPAKRRTTWKKVLIAPCGINCRVCGMYQKRSHPCLGCRLRTTKKSHLCVIKNCREERCSNPSLCLGCAKFPCPRLRALDQRYRGKRRRRCSASWKTFWPFRKREWKHFYKRKPKSGPVPTAGRCCGQAVLSARPAARRAFPKRGYKAPYSARRKEPWNN